jgi:membrane associated rhomboid family serine protease
MNDIRLGGYSMLPVVVKNLLIINVLVYLATLGLGSSLQIDLADYLGLHYFLSPHFSPHQLVTYMFMHSSFDFSHILFNMFALWMFGSTLENYWGPKKFLIYYMVAGIGAGIIQLLVMYFQFTAMAATLTPDIVSNIITEGPELWAIGRNYSDSAMGGLNAIINTTVVGASGSIYGLLLAFGMTFPEALIYIYFLFPIKAKWFVVIFGALELFGGIRNSASDNVAHFAHLGGMLFGFILIKIWKNKRFY